MTIKEIIILACTMIEQDEVARKLEAVEVLSEEEENVKNDLLKCFNFIQNEIATEFIPLLTKEKISSEDKAFSISNLSERLAYILSLKDENGENIKHKIIGDKIIFDGEGEICYCYCPKKKDIDDESELLLPERVISYGVLREYFLLQGLASEASVFETKFKNSLANFVAKKSAISMPKRIWR